MKQVSINVNNQQSRKMASTSAALEGLPKQFVTSMKTLFEIMDDKNSGYVKFTGIVSNINLISFSPENSMFHTLVFVPI